MKNFTKFGIAVLGIMFLQSCNNDAYELKSYEERKIDSVKIDNDTMTVFNM
ncbi:hypothetical protein [Soonwooa sp.]|nr:hypothetical protein [Soonwooa sp.]